MQGAPRTVDPAGSAQSAPPRADTPSCRLAVTLGDPRGIGPEVVAASLRVFRARRSRPHVLVIGPSGTGAQEHGDEFLSTGHWTGGNSAAAGALAGRAIERAARLAMEGRVDAVVTAPIDKTALHAAGYPYPGHTEMLAALAGSRDVAMMMAAEETAHGHPLRVVLATTHIALRDVPRRLDARLLERQVEITAAALTHDWHIEQPRVALCAFNPHASDGGLFGDEERTVYEPALRALRDRGLDVYGPVPADTVFVRALRGEFDVVVAPYHDVGMAAFKTATFGHGVNVTLGLPFPRTSPDHGTALDIAGRGVADPSSMIEAIALAERLASTRAAVDGAP